MWTLTNGELGGDLGVGVAAGNQGDQVPFPGGSFPGPGAGSAGPAEEVSRLTNSTAVARVTAAPRCTAS